MKLRPLSTPHTEHVRFHDYVNARDLLRADEQHAERLGNGPFAGFQARLHAMAVEEILARPLPDRDLGSLQGVRSFRRRTMSETVHPDMHVEFDQAELAEVVEEASCVTLNPKSPHFSYIENSQHAGLVGLQTEAQEKALGAYIVKLHNREVKKRKRAAAAGHKIDVSIVPEIDAAAVAEARAKREKWKAIHRSEIQIVCDRWEHGFHQAETQEIAGHSYAPFSEVLGPGVLRSHLSPSLARVPQLFPRRVKAGTDKAVLMTTTYKVLALDAPYVELDRKREGMVVVELDSVWLTPQALRVALLGILPPHMLPQLIVGRVDPDGRLLRPHLIWLLNPRHVDADGVVRDGTVWFNPIRTITDENGNAKVIGDKRCSKKAIHKFHAVQRWLVALLVPIGADPACHNIWRPKNPLSPYWSTFCTNDDFWPVLDDFEKIPDYNRKVDEDALEEMAAKLRLEATGAEPTTSNLAWKLVGNIIKPMAKLALATRDPDFLEAARSTEALSAWFDARVRPIAEAEIEPSKALDLVLRRRCDFAANWCRSARPGRRVRRGRDRDLITATVNDGNGGKRNLTAEERATAAAERTNTHRHALPMHRLLQELVVAVKATGTVDKTAFIKGLGTASKSFAYEHWDKACGRLDLIETEIKGRFRRADTKIKRSDYSGDSIKPSLPSDNQPAIVSTVPGQPTLDSASPDQRSTVDLPGFSGPSDPPWPHCVQSSPEPHQRSAEACLEPA